MANLIRTISYVIYEHQPISEDGIMRLCDVFRSKYIEYPQELMLSIEAKYNLMGLKDHMGIPMINSMKPSEIYGMKIKVDPNLPEGCWTIRYSDVQEEAIDD